jgi:hypothetical protein
MPLFGADDPNLTWQSSTYPVVSSSWKLQSDFLSGMYHMNFTPEKGTGLPGTAIKSAPQSECPSQETSGTLELLEELILAVRRCENSGSS